MDRHDVLQRLNDANQEDFGDVLAECLVEYWTDQGASIDDIIELIDEVTEYDD